MFVKFHLIVRVDIVVHLTVQNNEQGLCVFRVRLESPVDVEMKIYSFQIFEKMLQFEIEYF